jgi:hypothetical protein
MSSKDLLEQHLAGIVKEAQESLERFNTAVAQGEFRVSGHNINGARDITDRRLKDLEAVCEECRRLMRSTSDSKPASPRPPHDARGQC